MIPHKRRAVLARMVFCLTFIYSTASIFATNDDEQLLSKAKQLFGPLPLQMISNKNPVTANKVTLGKTLFYETRISVDGSVSCAKCHPFSLYSADGLEKSVGHDCRLNPRNAPTLLNAANQISMHWIGNRIDVEDQAKQSVVGPPSFGMPSYEAVEEKLKAIPGYGTLFQRAYPGDINPVTIANFADAVGAFERTLITPSVFDTFIRGKTSALNADQKKGLKLFMESGCSNCHTSPCFGGQFYKNFGMAGQYWESTKSKSIDEGRFAVTKDSADLYVFKVPILRNVARTSPYFHDGSIVSLHEAVGIMAKLQLQKNLSDSEINCMVIFLQSLTGKIPGDLLIVPLLPPNALD
jgi:cytochrome c peroxidase